MTGTGGERSWLKAEVDGRPVRFWLFVGAVIAVTTLGVGAWWTYGLNRQGPGPMAGPSQDASGAQPTPGGQGMSAAQPPFGGGDARQGMAQDGMRPASDVRLPPVRGIFNGQTVFFVHSEASDPYAAGLLTGMMGGSPVLLVPELASVPDLALAAVYVFTNGVRGEGPLGYQLDVFDSAPPDPSYRPLRRVHLVTWSPNSNPVALGSAQEILEAERLGALAIRPSDVVVNMPFLTWPGGQR
ncbi:MAG: hypothetical protein M3133_00125 [Actinomycetota bacterium]|nr:hypothetical protein [Actinomycetota bacterium]